jgi:hypothetical protein
VCSQETPALAEAGLPGTPPARPVRGTGPLRHGNPRGDPNLAPRCGARTRSGCVCRAPAMANGRCRFHGGKSTGPRTQAGMARMAAAHTTHGRYSASGALQRAAWRYVRTVIVRSRLLAQATLLRAHLPPEMAARLEQGPPELRAPKHPSQVAFEAEVASTACYVSPGGAGAGRMAGTGRAMTEKAGVMPNWRDAERTASLAEVAARAPWRVAIAFARAAKRTAREARAAKRTERARLASGKARRPRSDPMTRETAARVAGLHADRDGPATGCAVTPRPGPDSLLVETNPLYRELALRAAGLRARSSGQPAVARPPDPVCTPCDINPKEREVRDGPRLARQPAVARRPDPVCTPCDINPMEREAGDGPSLARLRLTPTKAMALGSTTLAGTWAPGVRALLAAEFGHPTPPGWRVPQVRPVGWAAVPGGSDVQQPLGRVAEGMRHAGPAAGGRPGGRNCAPGTREPAGKRGRQRGG